MMKTAAAETNVELNVKFKDGLKEIENFCNKIFTKKDIYGIITMIDQSYNYFNEIHIRTTQGCIFLRKIKAIPRLHTQKKLNL